jgi:hypothetical protein
MPGGRDVGPPDPATGPEAHPAAAQPALDPSPDHGPPGQPGPPQMPDGPPQGPAPGFSPPPPPPQMPTSSASTPNWDAGAGGEVLGTPGSPTGAQAATPVAVSPGEPLPDAADGPAPAYGAVLADEGDWLDRICPYLLSEDGSYRSTQPEEGHRCTAQDPPGTLPLAFQERYCLTDRHVRCEMFKYAQSMRSAALEEEGIPAEQVKGARFRPSVRSVPLALGTRAEGQGGGGSSHRPLFVIAIVVGALVIIAFVLAILFGSSGDDPGAGLVDGPSPSAQASAAAPSTPEPTPAPTPEQTAGPDSSPAASPFPAVATVPVNYEVQEGEALVAIANKFGVTRRRILRANESMDEPPYVTAGDLIIVPAAASMTIEELEAIPGFLGLAE